MSCMNTQMMNSRQADEDYSEALDDAIDARAAELLKPGEACDPFDGLGMCAAFENASWEQMTALGELLAERKFEQAGILVDRIVNSYWSKKAEELAVRELT